MKFYRIIITFIFIVTIFALTACGEENIKNYEKDTENSETETETEVKIEDTEAITEEKTEAPEKTEPDERMTEIPHIEGILEIRDDGGIVIDGNESSEDRSHTPLDDLFSVVRNKWVYKGEPLDISYIEVKGKNSTAKINLYGIQSGEGDDIYDIRDYVKSVEVFGQKVTPKVYGDDLCLYFNGTFQAFFTEEYFVISNLEMDSDGSSFIFYDGGYTEIKVNKYDNTSIVFFEKDGDLIYERTASKFIGNVDQIVGGLFIECVAKDELYRESGYAELINGELELTPTEKVTVEEKFDLEAEWALWCSNVDIDLQNITMEEYLAENAKKYERAE